MQRSHPHLAVVAAVVAASPAGPLVVAAVAVVEQAEIVAGADKRPAVVAVAQAAAAG